MVVKPPAISLQGNNIGVENLFSDLAKLD